MHIDAYITAAVMGLTLAHSLWTIDPRRHQTYVPKRFRNQQKGLRLGQALMRTTGKLFSHSLHRLLSATSCSAKSQRNTKRRHAYLRGKHQRSVVSRHRHGRLPYSRRKARNRVVIRSIVALPCVAYTTRMHGTAPDTEVTNKALLRASFDTDSVHIAVDCGASCTMTPFSEDFLPGTEKPVNMNIRGLGQAKATTKGTVQWAFTDDQGQSQTFSIHDTLWVPSLTNRLLSPQHFAQTQVQQSDCVITDTAVVLSWGNHRYVKTIPLNDSNIGVMRTAPGIRKFAAFYTATSTSTEASEPKQIYCFPAVDSEEAQQEGKHGEGIRPPTRAEQQEGAGRVQQAHEKRPAEQTSSSLFLDDEEREPSSIPENPLPM